LKGTHTTQLLARFVDLVQIASGAYLDKTLFDSPTPTNSIDFVGTLFMAISLLVFALCV
jgi:hypothetical protein